ncbi:MAG: COX aromatic rich motif-containing protein, partial [Pseudomonas sp.]
PCMIVLVLAVLTWRSSHALDPYKPLESDVKPVTIQAISLDWKWLFIYPEEKVAVVNEIKFPVNTPLNFEITSDTVMNAFFIPHLGSMIYSMAAMETKLHLIANETGEFPGMSSHYSGAGFAKMHFTAYSVTDAQYRQWLDQVRAGEQSLDKASFKALGEAKNSEWYPVTYFGKVEDNLFDWVIAKHMGDNKHYGMKHSHAGAAAADASSHEAHEGHAPSDAHDAKESGKNLDATEEHEHGGHEGHMGSGE